MLLEQFNSIVDQLKEGILDFGSIRCPCDYFASPPSLAYDPFVFSLSVDTSESLEQVSEVVLDHGCL